MKYSALTSTLLFSLVLSACGGPSTDSDDAAGLNDTYASQVTAEFDQEGTIPPSDTAEMSSTEAGSEALSQSAPDTDYTAQVSEPLPASDSAAASAAPQLMQEQLVAGTESQPAPSALPCPATVPTAAPTAPQLTQEPLVAGTESQPAPSALPCPATAPANAAAQNAYGQVAQTGEAASPSGVAGTDPTVKPEQTTLADEASLYDTPRPGMAKPIVDPAS